LNILAAEYIGIRKEIEGNAMMEQDKKITVKINSELEEIVPEYLELVQNDINSMLVALDNGDFDTMRVAGHKMKGSGGGYGFDFITEIGGKIETLAESKNSDEIRVLVEKISTYLENVNIVYES
jgi:HPt (histidine-containing phosphotransfer) domain-containing protein